MVTVLLGATSFGQGSDSTRYTKSSQYSLVYQAATVNVYVAFDATVPADAYSILGNIGTNKPATTNNYYVPGCYAIRKEQPLGVPEVLGPLQTTFLAGQFGGSPPYPNPYYTAQSYIARGVAGRPEWIADGGKTVTGVEWRDLSVPASYTPGNTLPPNVINVTINVSANSSEPPIPGATKPTDPLVGGDTGSQASENDPPTGKDCGMLHYSVHSLLVSLHLTDTPLSYIPAFGPPVNLTVNYNHRDVQPVVPDTESAAGFTNFGPQWSFNWLSYVTDDPGNPAQAQVYVRGGGTETYTGYEAGSLTYARDRQSQALLIRSTPTSYEKQFPDGHRYLFTQSDGSLAYPRRIFLTKVIDPHGNEVNLAYNGFNRLETITDATGKVSTLHYEQAPDWYYRVTKVVDPFGRSATFQYYPDGRLWKITDAIDLTSEVTYEVGGNFVNTLTTPYGVTQFAKGENGTQRWIEITDPRNTKERVEYRDFAPGILDSETAPAGFFNTDLQRRNTFYWDKKAFAVAAGDYTKAHVTHWLKSADGTATTSIVENEKAALENRVWYGYEGQTAGNRAGTSDQPIKIARRLNNGTTQLSQFTYNGSGSPMNYIDPVGRSTTYSYHANDIDLHEVRQTTGGINQLLSKMENYVGHLPQTITDAAGQQTGILYNARGQVETVTNAKGEVTKFVYDEVAAHPEFGRLLTVTQAFGTALAATTTSGYDAYGRVSSMTDSENYTVTLAYDAIGGDPLKSLDRPTRVTFPDNTFQESRYDDSRWPLSIAHTRDRLGRETASEYNALGQVVKVTDPQGRMTQFVQCPCGAMDKIIDARGNETEWARDLQKRITGKKIAGQTVATYEYEPDTGRLWKVTDALGQVTTRAYYADDRLAGVTYTNEAQPTADVSWTYDPVFPRLATMSDGTGTTTYGYHPIDPTDGLLGDGQPATTDGPLANDTISYEYDELGRPLGREINGAANASTVGYDALGRVNVITNPLGQFDPFYVNKTGRLDHVLWPNGQRTNYAWKPNVEDQRLESITHLDPTPQTQSQHTYGYDTEGKIQTWQTLVAGSTAKFTFGYNASDELEETVQRAEPSQALLHASRYGYDLSGNRISVLEDSKFASTPANAKNQLTGSSGNGSLLFRGTINEPSTITLAGQAATVTGLEWSGFANVTPGLNSIELKATETTVAPGFNAQTTTRHIELTLTADPARTFAYDDNGNMTDNGATQTYEWDAANRLVAINYTGTLLKTEFTYDGLSRRVKIVEKDNGTTTSTKQFVWEGFSIAEERDAGNSVTKSFFGQGEKRGALKLFYATDHLGSIREVTDDTGAVRARYDYTLWGARSTNAITVNAIECDFGFTGHYQHGPGALVVAAFRFYSADLGRWLSRDPIEEEGGLNLYGYVLNDPINLIDPFGLQPPFLGPNGNAIPGSGVDLSFHSQGVNSNPRSNPRNAWDNSSTFTYMAHGSPSSIVDQRSLPSGDATQGLPRLGPKDIANIIKNNPNWPGSDSVISYSCKTGAGGKNSLAQKLADQLKVPVWAPTDNLKYGGTPGKSTGISNGGQWQQFQPRPSKPWWKLW